jgi:hypothetical protein
VICATGCLVFGGGMACRTLVGGSQPFLLAPLHSDFDRLRGEAVFVFPAVRQPAWAPWRMAAIDPSPP